MALNSEHEKPAISNAINTNRNHTGRLIRLVTNQVDLMKQSNAGREWDILHPNILSTEKVMTLGSIDRFFLGVTTFIEKP